MQSENANRFARLIRHRGFRLIAVGLLAFLFVLLIYGASTAYLTRRWDATAPRNADTGILLGAESLHVGPETSSSAVLLVHGFVGGSSNFSELPDRLADQGYRVRALRLPGHGTSPLDFAETNGDELLAHVLKEIRALRQTHERVFVVGHSMGGALSTLVAQREQIDGLVLAAPYYGVNHRWYYVLRPETWTNMTWRIVPWAYKSDGFVRINRREALGKIFSYRWIPSTGSKTLAELGLRARDPETLSGIDSPTLMILPRNDHAADSGQGSRAFEMLAMEEKELVWLENSDHHVFWDYDREIVYAEILSFLDGLTEDAPAIKAP